MGFTKETRSNRWENCYSSTWDNVTLNWNSGWTQEAFIEINTYSYLTSTWSQITNKWQSLT